VNQTKMLRLTEVHVPGVPLVPCDSWPNVSAVP
jgi:hypothetical protein